MFGVAVGNEKAVLTQGVKMDHEMLRMQPIMEGTDRTFTEAVAILKEQQRLATE